MSEELLLLIHSSRPNIFVFSVLENAFRDPITLGVKVWSD
jgi:hypothetical protein